MEKPHIAVFGSSQNACYFEPGLKQPYTLAPCKYYTDPIRVIEAIEKGYVRGVVIVEASDDPDAFAQLLARDPSCVERSQFALIEVAKKVEALWALRMDQLQLVS